jgi:phosphatidate cytidylyltransferase
VLAQRVATALVLVPATLWLLLGASTPVVAAVLLVVVGAAAAEWQRLAAGRPPLRAVFATLLVVLVAGGYRYEVLRFGVLVAASALWLVMPWWLAGFPARAAWDRPVALAVGGAVLLAACWLALVDLHGRGGGVLVLALLLVIWAADIGAYFVGRAIGSVRLAAAVSPGKSREGALGGIVAATLVGAGLGWAPLPEPIPLLERLLACAGIAVVSIVGDLGESMLKRARGVKDSGRLLPGHGGVLDRIDSLLSAAPLFALWWVLRAQVMP